MKRSLYMVDDHPLVREALVLLIEGEPDLELCGMAETATEALAAIPEVNPDLVLVDLSLPGMNGIELIQRLLALNPLQRTVILSGHTEPAHVEKSLAAGARGYILKGEPLTIMKGIRHALGGEVYVSRSIRPRHHTPRKA